jgi:hypothetical protein
LRIQLVDAYQSFKKRWDAEGKTPSGKKVPVMMMIGGHLQPGPSALTCYACGTEGHKRGDSVCSAKASDVWDGAPDHWKKMMKKSGGRGGGKGRGRGKGNGNGKSGGKGRGDGICRNFATGNGYCKFGANCKYLHEKRGNGNGNGGGKGKSKSQKKEIKKTTALVLKAVTKKICDAGKRKKEYDADDDDETSSKKMARNLFNLISGKDESSSMMISCEDSSTNPKLSKWGYSNVSAMMISCTNEGETCLWFENVHFRNI